MQEAGAATGAQQGSRLQPAAMEAARRYPLLEAQAMVGGEEEAAMAAQAVAEAPAEGREGESALL